MMHRHTFFPVVLFLAAALIAAAAQETAPHAGETGVLDADVSSLVLPSLDQEKVSRFSPPAASASDALLGGVGRPDMCAVWVHSDGALLRSAENCRALVDRLLAINADDVFVVVRAFGDAAYRSELAPFPANWVGTDLDPLAEILSEAHRSGRKPLRVHAVLNLLPLYSDAITFAPPPDHLMLLHPEWISKDEAGNERDPDGVYWLDPAIPTVRRHLQAVVYELLTRYEVDGVHFAGLRYPGHARRWGYNPLALSQFRAETNASEAMPVPDRTDWVRWRSDQLTLLVRLLSETARQARPGVQVSASVLATGDPPGRDGALSDFQTALQDWPTWCAHGFFDAILLENTHTPDPGEARFVRWIDYGNARKGRTQLLVQVSGEANTESGVRHLLRLALARGCDGVLLRSWQVPARDLADGSKLFDFLGSTFFSRDYEMPAYARNALMVTLPSVESFSDPVIVRELPPPLPLAPPPKAASRPVSEADIARALLGEEAFAELDRLRETPAREPALPDIGLLPDEAIPPPPETIGVPPRVRVRLKNGRSFLADYLGEGEGASALRPAGQSAVVSVPHHQIESILVLRQDGGQQP